MTAPAEVRLVPALPVDEDARLVMAWRNDPVTRAASFHGDEKRWPAFGDEFRTYFDAPLAPRFAVVGDARVGFIRYRPCEDPEAAGASAVDISIQVAPEHRGRGVGTALIVVATELALAHFGVVLAEIKPGNAPSVRAFVAAGYRRVDDGVHLIQGESIPVERYVCRRE